MHVVHRILIGAALLMAAQAEGQPLRSSMAPLDTERAETLPSGITEVSFGITYAKDERTPFFTVPGALRSQRLIHAPQLGFRIGAGDWAEIQASYELLYLDETTAWGQTNRQFGSGDARLHTKVRLRRENRWPGIALRFGAKLPNANREARLGTDDTDFDLMAVLSKDMGPLSMHANLGILLMGNSGPFLGNHSHAGGQDDLFSYSFGFESAPMGGGNPDEFRLRLMAEVSGYAGSHYDNNRNHGILGIRLEKGPGALYIAGSTGFMSGNENLGLRAGFLCAFDPFKWFED